MSERQFNTTLPVRVDTGLLDACKAAAEADSRTLGSWVRLILREAAERLPKTPRKKKA